jgi:beta-ketoacyl-acyl-carrier-protein synthase II
MSRRVVVTGLGLVTALGNNVRDTWANIKAGVCGLDKITYFDATNFAVKIAAEVKNFEPLNYMEAKEVRRHDYHQHYIIAAAQEAMQNSGLEISQENASRSSTFVASSTGGLKSYEEYIDLIRATGDPRKMTPFAIPMLIVNAGNNVVAIKIGAMGPSQVLVSACATGADNIGYAAMLIKAGRIDRALAGCSDYPITALGVAAFDRMRAMSRHPDPKTALRPFDKDRTGMIFGEGCGVVVLEELESAKNRGALIMAELVGYGASTDAFHRTAPLPDGQGAYEAMRLALDDAQLNPTQIDFINAHGTSTILNDPMESKAIKRVFGDYAYKIPISATKPMTGHAMGSTSAIEAAFTVLSICDQIAPPTLNHDNPDPECDLDYVPHEARDIRITYAMTNSFGFGGHNAALIFRRFDD